jgi:microcystin-dependent protein
MVSVQVNGVQTAIADIMPVGAQIMLAGQAYIYSGPAGGWLLCNGSAISRTTYSQLFTAIGTTFGAGDGSTTFNIPTGMVTMYG